MTNEPNRAMLKPVFSFEVTRSFKNMAPAIAANTGWNTDPIAPTIDDELVTPTKYNDRVTVDTRVPYMIVVIQEETVLGKWCL